MSTLHEVTIPGGNADFDTRADVAATLVHFGTRTGRSDYRVFVPGNALRDGRDAIILVRDADDAALMAELARNNDLEARIAVACVFATIDLATGVDSRLRANRLATH